MVPKLCLSFRRLLTARHAGTQQHQTLCNPKHARSKFRILAAGGDGTVAWILKTVMELGLDPPPPVAVLPLGTGNDLSLSFGWGNTFQQAWIDVRPTVQEDAASASFERVPVFLPLL